jgi:hypothetical protein
MSTTRRVKDEEECVKKELCEFMNKLCLDIESNIYNLATANDSNVSDVKNARIGSELRNVKNACDVKNAGSAVS